MLSAKKRVLKVCEACALAGAAGGLGVGVLSWLQPQEAAALVSAASIVGLVVMIAAFVPTLMLCTEFIRTTRNATDWREGSAGLSAKEVEAIASRAPTAYKVGALLGLVLLIGGVAVLKIGVPPNNHPLSAHEVTWTALCLAGCCMLCLPVLGSAVRMPGGYGRDD